MEKSKIYCSNVRIARSSLCTQNSGDFDGAFAGKNFKKGELIEKGIMRRLPDDFDGNKCPYVFTWSDKIPNKIWAMGSGCSPFYNTSKYNANTEMVRFFDEDRFEIYAKNDILEGEELLHTYISLEWRTCFKDINQILS